MTESRDPDWVVRYTARIQAPTAERAIERIKTESHHGQWSAVDVGRLVCKHCGVEIEHEAQAGWVEKRSGDDGGTYDVCVGTWDSEEERHGRHEPFGYLMP